jgi:hypothetical protein
VLHELPGGTDAVEDPLHAVPHAPAAKHGAQDHEPADQGAAVVSRHGHPSGKGAGGHEEGGIVLLECIKKTLHDGLGAAVTVEVVVVGPFPDGFQKVRLAAVSVELAEIHGMPRSRFCLPPGLFGDPAGDEPAG